MRDYKFRLVDGTTSVQQRRRLRWMALLAVPMTVTGLLGFGVNQADTSLASTPPAAEAPATAPEPADSTLSVELTLPDPLSHPTPPAAPVTAFVADTTLSWRTLEVKRGDSLAVLFQRSGFSAADLQRLMQSGDAAVELTRIFPGDEIRVAVDDTGILQQLTYQKSPTRIMRIERAGDSYQAELIEKTFEKRLARANGTIEDSLFSAATRAGLSERMTMELASIFGWDIDFALDIRSGDQFSLVYEELYLDGEKADEGRIVAAEFINQGRQVQAVLFTKPDGVSDYYSPDGHSMRKAFLRSPVDFRRISSRFTRSRCHPVLGVCRPHRGVDYAASIGTPIKAAGDGKVAFAGTKGGYGQTVILQHGQNYSTLYAHMSRIGRGILAGKRIQQGQVIGYVGRSGVATGPHLHYEFRVNGVHRNPLTVELPQAQPLGPEFRKAFQAQAEQLLAQLDLMRRFAVAQAPLKP